MNSYVVVILAALVYFGLPEYRTVAVPTPQWFPALADAMLHGRLWIEPDGANYELIPTAQAGRYHVAYPPLPAIVLLPFVAVLGDLATSSGMCRLLMVVAVLLFGAVARRAAIRIHGKPWSARQHLLLVAFFAFGTAVWESAARGGDWHLAHACAVCGLLLALSEHFGRRRALLVGAAIGLAMLARPTVMFAGMFFLFEAAHRRSVRDVIRLSAGPAAAVILLAGYNFARFGDPFDFAYSSMVFRDQAQQMLMSQYGQFNLAFVPRNLFWFFAAPPSVRADGGFPWIAYDPRGLSVFLASPALAYAVIGAIRSDRGGYARIAVVASVVCLIPLLLYFNTGFWQFGHRFSLDYLPVLMIAVIMGLGPSPSKWARGLLIASIAIHVWGIAVCGMERIAPLPVWLVPGA